MREIKELDQKVIDKIAAGEVVERPASVVKELVENSIDAGASAISVEIEGGGIDLIRVTDNGSGIYADQLETAFKRHATSKLSREEDLELIGTLGFRGEALSSIAAVSKVEVFTKTEEEMVGSHFLIEGGTILDREAKAAPDGTTFIIRSLFYNVPARRKFLKSPMTEANYIRELIEKLSLSHPEIAFKFRTAKADKLVTVGDGKLLDAIYCVWGRSIANHLIAADGGTEGIAVRGYIGKSELNRPNRTMEVFFVNGRLVKSSLLSKATEDGGEGFVMKHQYPFAILFIDIDSPMVDVNVHPTKREVRFSDEPAVYEAVKAVVKNAYLAGDKDRDTTDLQRGAVVKPPEVTQAAEPFEKERLSQIKEKISSQIQADSPYEKKYERSRVDAFLSEKKEMLSQDGIALYGDGSTQKAENSSQQAQIHAPLRRETLEKSYVQTGFISRDSAINHRMIGLAFDTYWIFEYDGALFLVDQHAAHEKVNYERLMKHLADHEMTSQLISPSIVITLTAQEKQLVFSQIEAFEELGFRIEDFGENEIALAGVPGNLFDIDARELFTNVLAGAQDWGGEKVPQIVREKIAQMSCKAAVKGSRAMSAEEMDALFMEMMEADEPYHCPHGRPTVVRITKEELDRRFRRIVN